MSIHWTKRPTYEEIVRDLEKDYKVKLPDRVALSFYDSFAHAQFQQMQNQISTSQTNVDAARDHAMSMAADDEDTLQHAILQHAAQTPRNIARGAKFERATDRDTRTQQAAASRRNGPVDSAAAG